MTNLDIFMTDSASNYFCRQINIRVVCVCITCVSCGDRTPRTKDTSDPRPGSETEVFGHIGTNFVDPKCLGFEVCWVQSVL